MPAGDACNVSRRGVLTTLATLFAAGCSRAAFLAVNLPAAFGPYKRHVDIEYGVGKPQSLDVYVPQKPAAGARPLFVFWHGGRWTFGDKQDYRFVGAALAEQGYVVVIPNYRHYPQVKMAGFMADAASAALWAVAHAPDYGADPQQLYLMGHSAGAHMAALLALDTSHFAAVGQTAPPVRGVVGLSGPYDFLPFTDDDMRDMFGPVEKYPLSQPINFARADAPPMLLVHGLKDDTVWPKNTRNLASALSARNVRVTLKFYPKLVHADTVAALSSTVRGRAPTLADIVAFVDNNQA